MLNLNIWHLRKNTFVDLIEQPTGWKSLNLFILCQQLYSYIKQNDSAVYFHSVEILVQWNVYSLIFTLWFTRTSTLTPWKVYSMIYIYSMLLVRPGLIFYLSFYHDILYITYFVEFFFSTLLHLLHDICNAWIWMVIYPLFLTWCAYYIVSTRGKVHSMIRFL